jgi:xylose isomerase
LVKLLEDAQWDGMRHFDAHAYRTEDEEGVWEFARGCMRTYLILADKAARFREDAEIQEALQAARFHELSIPTSPAGLGSDALAEIRGTEVDVDALGAQGYGHERLDQLVNELLLGVR